MLIIFFYLWYLIEWFIKLFKYTNRAYYEISFEGTKLSNENKNILSNFIIITRENNPQKGTIYGELNNIPGDAFYTIGTSEKFVSGKNILISYKMRQPYAVDYIYEIKIISNKLDLLNIFEHMLEEFPQNRGNNFDGKNYYLFEPIQHLFFDLQAYFILMLLIFFQRKKI